MIGDTVGDRYEIRAPLGEGGMQVVFEAFDQLFRRSVALKRAKGKSAEKRFQRSATLSARINHPNVAKTLDYFTNADGTQYLVEEIVRGGDLQEMILQKLELTDPYLTARLFHHLAKGLRSAHASGVVHRDIKPNNILFASDSTAFDVKFTDFGIAKMVEEEIVEALGENGGLSSTSSTFLGAVPYMAPEMLRNTRKASFPSDVWSLAAVAYHVLTGERPYGSGIDALDAIRAGKLPENPTKFIPMSRQFGEIVTELYDIIAACFAKDPSARPTAAQLVDRCDLLCYPVASYNTGVVKFQRYSYGFIAPSDGGGDVQYHSESVFGADPVFGDRVFFAAYPGYPQPRAMPVVRCRPKA